MFLFRSLTLQAELDKEHWCSVLQEVALPGTGADPAAFLAKAVDFTNERCEGTLSCSVFIPPQVTYAHRRRGRPQIPVEPAVRC